MFDTKQFRMQVPTDPKTSSKYSGRLWQLVLVHLDRLAIPNSFFWTGPRMSTLAARVNTVTTQSLLRRQRKVVRHQLYPSSTSLP